MNDLRPRDWFFGGLVLVGLYAMIGFDWLPGLVVFLVGAVGVVTNAARWESS